MSKASTGINARAILSAQARLRRQGSERVMAQLERAEPDLAEYAMEGLTAIYHDLLKLGVPAKATHQVQRQVESLVLVCLTAARPDGV